MVTSTKGKPRHTVFLTTNPIRNRKNSESPYRTRHEKLGTVIYEPPGISRTSLSIRRKIESLFIVGGTLSIGHDKPVIFISSLESIEFEFVEIIAILIKRDDGRCTRFKIIVGCGTLCFSFIHAIFCCPFRRREMYGGTPEVSFHPISKWKIRLIFSSN